MTGEPVALTNQKPRYSQPSAENDKFLGVGQPFCKK